MGKTKKRFNWKARLSEHLPNNSQNEVQESVELEWNVQQEKYDSCNPLQLPSQKKKEKEKLFHKVILKKTKQLSKKQKRKLEKVIEKKKKNLNRSELIEKLQKVQATAEELELITSTSNMQTFGLKKISSVTMAHDSATFKINTVKGSQRKKNINQVNKKLKMDPNIVGFDDESGEESSDNDSEESNEDENTLDISNNKTNNNDIELKIDETSCKESDDNKLISESSNLKQDSAISHEPVVFVPVNRTPEIQAVRELLPIYSEEQGIMEAIKENPVVVIHGATGSGKTTQVPQFLYEAGYTRNKRMIGITEPRRIAAVQMASRVGEEMNLPDLVSYQIRYEKTATEDKTEIKFMTDGVLLKEIRTDFLLSRYSVIIIDEAHERSVFSDVLIGLLSRILPLREKKGNSLKLIIMSATLRVEDFMENSRLFKQKPFLMTLDSRQYDVVLHFNTKTPTDYVEAAYNKVGKIHRQLPAGSILVFLTGEKEVTRLCRLLKKAFPFKEKTAEENKNPSINMPEFASKKFKRLKKRKGDESFADLPKIDLDDYSVEPFDYEGIQHQHSDEEEENMEDGRLLNAMPSANYEPLYVLPLYSVLPTDEQAKAFKPPPTGSRLCVIATNVAETSVTIPGLKYVVDSGKVKTRVYDKYSGGISSFAITWISKASANQRAGRAGRTEGGHCYRLYSSAVFEHDFPEFTLPDIQRIPVDDVLLQMKALGIDRVVNFPFPSSPDTEALKGAEKRLVMLGALQDLQKGQRYKDIAKWEYSAKITPLGKAMSRFPLSPRYAKMLLLSYKHQVIPYVIAMVSAMTVPEVFLSSEIPNSKDDSNAEPKSQYVGIKRIGAGKGKSTYLGDLMVLLRAVAAYEESENKMSFCTKYNIRKKAMLEIRKMRLQLIREMNRSFCDLNLTLDLRLEPPTDNQIDVLQKILASGMIDHVARKIPVDLQNSEVKIKDAYKCLDLEEMVFIHPSSILSKELPEFVVYQEIFQTSKYFMKTVAIIEPEWLTSFASSQCEFSSPLETPAPYYDKITDKIMCSMAAKFGRCSWDLPCVVMSMPLCLTKYNYFCFFLLDGQICNFFKEYKTHLLSPPSVMLKQWARLLPRTRHLLQSIIDKEVDSKEALFKVWKSNPKYLLHEYSGWILEDKHMELACKWPPKL